DGVGGEGFTQGASGLISTLNATVNALAIKVNTASGGSGTAALGRLNAAANATISVNAHGGAITDNNDIPAPPQQVINVSISGSNGTLLLNAAGGIGSGNPLETRVSVLQATNTGSGAIQIANNVDTLGALTVNALTNQGGGIAVSNVGALT